MSSAARNTSGSFVPLAPGPVPQEAVAGRFFAVPLGARPERLFSASLGGGLALGGCKNN